MASPSEGYFNHSRDSEQGEYSHSLSPADADYPMPQRYPSSYGEYGSIPESRGVDRRMSESHELLASHIQEGSDKGGLQTRYPFLSSSERRLLGQEFRRRDQLWRLSARTSYRFSVTFAICVGVMLLFKIYHDRGPLTPSEKRMFNTLNVALSLVMGMNVMSAFKTMASMAKWRLLSAHTYRLREVDLILSLDSFQNVFELMRVSTGRPMFCIVAGLWILIGIGAQVGVALLGLSQGMETGGVMRLSTGPVNITDMTYIYPYMGDRTIKPRLTPQKFQAHVYGDTSTYFLEGRPGQPDFSDAAVLEMGPGENDTYWKYHFRESFYVANPGANGMPKVKTNRSITVTPSCEHFPITKGQYANETVIVLDYGRGGNTTIDWMREYAAGATTYVSLGWDEVSAGNDSRSCGPRCNRIYIFQFADHGDPDIGHFFNCTIDISKVDGANPSQPFHQLPNQTAAIAAGAIGMDGFVSRGSRQFIRYPNSSSWGTPMNGSVISAERTVGRFAVGVIAAYDQYGPAVEVNGVQSHPAIKLEVNWGYVCLTLGCILIVQLLLGAYAVYYANSVFCKEDSHLSNARLLRPFVERLGSSGSSAGSIDLAMTFTHLVRYGVHSELDSSERRVHHLDLGDDLRTRENFPDGFYD